LEAQNQALDKHGQELSASITNLTLQIAETEKKLAASQGDKAFLESEFETDDGRENGDGTPIQ